MKNNNDEAMKNYFDSMLRSDSKVESLPVQEAEDETVINNNNTLPKQLVFSESSTQVESLEQVEPKKAVDDWENISVEDEFQVLFFEINHVTFAVPLTELGGIQELDESLNFLMGKPAWFSGVMNHHERLYNIVDTAKWLKLGADRESLQYSHYVLLGKSAWGLSCEKLLGTETLHKEQVRWRDKKGSRPWLAGMVKKKMCALLHAEELIKLLNQGMDITG